MRMIFRLKLREKRGNEEQANKQKEGWQKKQSGEQQNLNKKSLQEWKWTTTHFDCIFLLLLLLLLLLCLHSFFLFSELFLFTLSFFSFFFLFFSSLFCFFNKSKENEMTKIVEHSWKAKYKSPTLIWNPLPK